MKSCLSLVFALAAVPLFGADLPSRDLKGLSPEAISAACAEADAHSWWTRIENTLYSPAFAEIGESFDKDRSHYRYVVGAEVAPELASARVGGGSGMHILYFPNEIPDVVTPSHLCRGHGDGILHPIEPGMEWVLPRLASPAPRDSPGITNAQVQVLVNQVDQNRYFNDIVTLGAFGTRNTARTGNVNARNWIASQFTGMGLTVTTPQLTVNGTPTRNVVGMLNGSLFPGEYLVVGAHFDSLPSTGNAPGAEDNASGTASVLEIARILAPVGTQRTIYFIAFTGEEQGLRGSADWVSDLTTPQRSNFRGAIIMDMVSYTGDAERDVLLETSAIGTSLLNEMADAAADFTTLSVYTSFNPFGSDHIPFLNANLPAVLAIENDWDIYPAYHQATDTTSLITRDLGASITKMNLAALARLANPQAVSATVGDDWMLLEDPRP